jgi:hypothetical protein
MNCGEFGFDWSRGFGSVWGQFWPIAIDRPTRPYNIASTTVQQVKNTSLNNWSPVQPIVTSNIEIDSTREVGKHGNIKNVPRFILGSSGEFQKKLTL